MSRRRSPATRASVDVAAGVHRRRRRALARDRRRAPRAATCRSTDSTPRSAPTPARRSPPTISCSYQVARGARARGRRRAAIAGRPRSRRDVRARRRDGAWRLGRLGRRVSRARRRAQSRSLSCSARPGDRSASPTCRRMSHIALALMGEGEAWVDGKRVAGARRARGGWTRSR